MADISLKTLGAIIRQRRQAIGLSQEELGARAGLHRTYICDVEQGTRNVSLGTLQRLSSALDISAWRLLQGAEGAERNISGAGSGVPV